MLAIDTSRNHYLNTKVEVVAAVKVRKWNHFSGELVLEELVFQCLPARRSILASSISKHCCLGNSPEEAVEGVGVGERKGISWYHLVMISALWSNISDPSARWEKELDQCEILF